MRRSFQGFFMVQTERGASMKVLQVAAFSALAASVSACGGAGGTPPNGFAQFSANGELARAHHRTVGPGVIVSSKFGGAIYGWAINENGTDGFFTEAPMVGHTLISTIETFDQTSGTITKVVARQRSKSENHELFADAILANDVGLIDDERAFLKKHIRRDVYDAMAPVLQNKITGTWTRPHGVDFLLYDIADQQTNPVAVMAATILDGVITKPPTFEVVVANVATNKILRTLYAPSGDGVNYPYFVAEDTATQHAYVPAANHDSETVFIDYDLRTGRASNNFVAPAFSGPVNGIAIDSATHVMCTTTSADYSVQMYDLKTEKQTFVGQIPNAGGEGQAGSSIAADPIDHLFLVEQPNSLLGGSEIYVYDEHGDVLEGLTGFAFGDDSGIQVTAASRGGYVAGPQANQLESFTY
jgi:hypothetical protein